MSYSLQDTSDLTALGNAIRAKNGSSDNYTVAQMATAVSNISTGSGESSPAAEFALAVLTNSSDLQNYTSMPSGISFPNNRILDYQFRQHTNLSLTSLPSSVSELGMYAFEGCSRLALTEINGLVISADAFKDCTGLTSLYIKNCWVLTGSAQFWGCTGLQTVTLDNFGFSSSSNTFKNCTSLTTVYIKGNCSLSNSAFNGCTNLTNIYVTSSQGDIANAPWGATNATIHYDWVPPTT